MFLAKSKKTIIAIALVAIAALVVSFYYPIYPDEITNIFLVGRNGLDNNNKLWLTPACIESEIYIPFPLIYIYEILFKFYTSIESHRELRYYSLILSIVFICFWIRTVYLKGNTKNIIIILLIFLWPPIYINSFIYLRPEKFMLIFLICSINIYVFRSNNLIFRLIYTVIASLIVINHPKAFYLLPIYLYVMFAEYKHHDLYHKITNYILLISLIIISYQSYVIGSATWVCKPIEFIKLFVASYSLNPTLIFTNVQEFFIKIFELNNAERSYRAVSQLFLRSDYDIGYMPNLIKLQFISIVVSMTILCLLLKIVFQLIKETHKENYFYIIYIITIAVIYLFGGNKSAYDISFIICAILLVVPFVVTKEIYIGKLFLYIFCLIIFISYLKIGKDIKKSWSGPGVQIRHKINYDELFVLKNKIEISNDSILYEDNTVFLFNDIADKYPVTYMMNLATRDNHLLTRNLGNKNYIFIGRCAYLNELTVLEPKLKIKNLENKLINGIPDSVCLSRIQK